MVRFENVGMRYGLGPEILRDISFTLDAGSFHLLTGPSGAGKTSLLKLIYLAERPCRGAISMFGRDIATTPRDELPALRRRIGVVFQEFRLLDHLTVFDNVSLPRRVMGESEGHYRAEVEELLSWVGLGNRLNAKPATLSGGEKQRVAIARAVVAKPELLLADEPTGNVDPEIGGRIMRLFIELNKLGTCVMIATHDTRIMERVPASRIYRLAEGKLTVAKAHEFMAEAKRA
ncbi:MAG: cell division ATP-binding protein FtsE [Alphaproteobacteria bacterium]|nr:cell division ATP-binding protein FtsE [Alphaproteobacteria bacterium]